MGLKPNTWRFQNRSATARGGVAEFSSKKISVTKASARTKDSIRPPRYQNTTPPKKGGVLRCDFFVFSILDTKYKILYTICMSWAGKRKLIYISSAVAILLLFIVLPTILHFYKAPTCADGKQNQDEQGIDCGGPCTLLCDTQYVPLTVLWSRMSKVTDGVYNVLAYIENPNLTAEANNLNYVFKLYDKNGLLLRERFGRTFVPANKVMAIFEPELQTGNQIPDRVEFTFTSLAVWVKQTNKETGLTLSQLIMSREDSAPRLSAILTNKTTLPIRNIEAIGIIYNSEGNTIAFSRTLIDLIEERGSQDLNFNWPKPFEDHSARTEIVLKLLK